MEKNGIWGWTLLQDTDITKSYDSLECPRYSGWENVCLLTTPQPPNPQTCGQMDKNILSATVAREQAGVYVSSDWRKLEQLYR